MAIGPITLVSDEERWTARQRSGRGCIRCGCTIYQYCAAEDAGGDEAFLLCPPCLGALQGMPQQAEVLARLRRAPVAGQAEFDRKSFAYSAKRTVPSIAFPGGAEMESTPYPILFGGKAIFGALPPERASAPFQLDVQLGLADGSNHLVVHQNAWVATGSDWLFARTGAEHRVSHAASPVGLTFRVVGEDRLMLSLVDTWSGGRHLRIDRAGAVVDGMAVTLRSTKSRLTGNRL